MRTGISALASVLLLLLSACDSSDPLQVDADISAELSLPQAEEPVLGAATGGPSEVGTWGSVMDWPHVAVSMATLPNGQVLTYSGSERRTWPTTEQTYSAIWDPATGIFQENLHQGHNMFCAAMSMTSDGKVLVNGGRNQGNSPWTTLFDYNNNEWQTVDNMASGGRWYPTTLATGDGKVMTALGTSRNTRNPDLWDPVDGWRVLNGIDFLSMRQRNNELGRENAFPLLSVAPNGNIYHYWDTVENQMINPLGNGAARPANPTTDGANHAGGVQFMYDVGKLLSTGRNDGSWGGNSTGASNEAFTIDLNGAYPDIRSTSNMRHNRKYQQLVPFPTGEVMVVGGNTTGAKFRDSGSVLEPEVWNPQTGVWRGMANMAIPRDYHSTAMLLTDGRILTAGGGYASNDPNSTGTHQDAQIFTPPYLYASNGSLATRPEVTATQASVDAGDALQVSTTGDVAYFSLIRMSATTHSMNTDTRFYKPEFTSAGTNQYTVTIHQNPNVSIPGYWMLFAIDVNGVPSEAQVIRITALDTRLENLALQGTATQSSEYNNTGFFSADKAIDGDLSGSDRAGSLTHTATEAGAWWELDLGRVVDIDTIRVWNRTDCCTDRLSDFHVLVSEQPFASTNLNNTLAQSGVLDFHTTGNAGRQTDVKVATQGRYVRVQLSGTNALHIAEVQVFGSKRTDLTNLAIGGTATQSSTYLNASYSAGNAIDGDVNGDNGGGNRTIGGGGGTEFDLSCGSNEVLAGVYGAGISSTYINSVGARCVSVDSSGNWIGQPRNLGTVGTASGGDYSRTCDTGWAVSGFSGRADTYLNQISLQCRKLDSGSTVSGLTRNLTSAGANIGTQQGPFICGGAVATGITGRSGSWMDAFGLQCPNAGTGVISHTNNDINAWWELDLGRLVDIDSVTIWNRTDCCTDRLSDFHLLVSDVPFSSKDLDSTISQSGVYNRAVAGAAAQTTDIVVGRTGRYLRVQLNSGNTPVPLHIAEVQVLAAELAAPLSVQPLVASPQLQGTDATFTANATGSGTLQYRWNFGDGNVDTAYTNNPSISHSYDIPGRYVVSLTVRDSTGEEIRSTFTQVIHPPVLTAVPKSSSGVLEHSTRSQVWNVNPDNNSVGVVDTQSLSLLAEIDVGNDPVSLAEAPDGNIWVVNRQSASISVVDASSLSVVATYPLQRASQPYGIVMDNNGAFVALQAVGKVQRVALDGSAGISGDVGANPRQLALNAAADTLYVSRYITNKLPGEDTGNVVVDDGTQKYGGEVLVLNAATLSTTDTIVMQHINRIASEHEGPGVPNYLGPVVISPAGDVAWLPSKQDNILAGDLRGGEGITFDQTVRAITSKIDLGANAEILSSRIDHDNASVATHSVFDPYGVTLFTSLEGNRQISVIDASTGIEIGRFDTGRAPQGLAVSKDGKRIYVHNFMDRTISVFDIESITQSGSAGATELATINVVSSEVLDATVLRGKQLFYDARDDRLAGLDYMSCASCHVDGEHDGRTWDFTSLGEGLRNTITLKGRAGTGHGILHWTGNFDEVQDFEGQIRDFAGGTGLMNDADFVATEAPLGAAKAGLSNDLDAMAAYLESLDKVDESPWRNTDGTMTAAALNGESLFVSNGCATCHTGAVFTDSVDALLHDVGTLMPESGQRLSGPLTGLDTPSLLGVWRTAPYLHDGSAPTLEDAIAAHTSVSVTVAEQADLASYLSQLDDGAPVIVIPPPVEPPAPATPGVSNPLNGAVIVVDGNLSEWGTAVSFGSDPDDTAGANTIDWEEATVVHDDDNFYIGYRNRGPVTESWGYGTYIDVDGNTATGFKGFSSELPIGSDYLIEGRVVLKYTGTGTNWSWQEIGTAQYSINVDTAELSVPRTLMGNPTTLRMYFLGNNTAVGGDAIDFYPDPVTDASRSDSERYFIYSVANAGGNSPPIAVAQNVSVAMNGQLSITLAGSDPNGDTLLFEIVDRPANGEVAGNAPTMVYVPATGFQGVDQFTFTVNDGSTTSAPATIAITVVGDTPNNQTTITVDGSLADWDGVDSFGIDPVDATSTGDVIDWREAWVGHDADNFYFAYRNNNPVVLSWGYGIYIDTDNNPATGFRNFDGSYPIGADYIIEANEVQKYTGTGTNWSWAMVSVNEVQVSGNNAEISISRSALDNASQLSLFFVGENAANNGTTVDYYPDNVVDASAPVRFFTYDAADQSVNVPPVAVTQNLTMNQDSTLSVTLTATDPNGGVPRYQITRQPANGTLTGTAPNVVYTPDSGFSGSDSFEFRASDALLNGDPAVVTITVSPTTPPNPNSNNLVQSLSIDGNLQDWAGLTPLPSDSGDIAGTAEQIDWRQGYIAHSATMLYLAYQNDAPIAQLTYGHAAYIGTDGSNATGFSGFSSELPFGADYLLEGTDLYKYSGSGNNWLWTYIATINAQQVGSIAEFGLSRAQLGNPAAIEIFWRGENSAVGGTGVDFYPDAVTSSAAPADQRRFRYVLQP